MDLPGYGPSQVEVRLFQYGQLSAATIGSDGKINGLNGVTAADLVGGTATAQVDLDVVGPQTITANYLGYQSILDPSSGSVQLVVAPPPDGRMTTGTVQIGTDPAFALPDGARLTGAAFDPLTGDIGSGSLWFMPGTLDVDTGFVGIVHVRYRFVQTTPFTGHVASDGTVTFDPTSLQLQARSYMFSG